MTAEETITGDITLVLAILFGAVVSGSLPIVTIIAIGLVVWLTALMSFWEHGLKGWRY